MAEPATVVQQHSCHQFEDRPYQCHTCGSSFTKSEHLVRHVRSHSRTKPFQCADCGRRYSRHDILLRHRRDVRCKDIGGATKQIAMAKPKRSQQHSKSAPSVVQVAPEHFLPPTQFLQASGSTMEKEAENPIQNSRFSAHENYQISAHSINNPALLTDPNSAESGFVDFVPQGYSNNLLNRDDLFPAEEFVASDDFFPFFVSQNLNDDLSNIQMFFDESASFPDATPNLPPTPAPDLPNVKQLWFTNISALRMNEVYPEMRSASSALEESMPTSPQPAGDEIDNRQREKFRQLLEMPAQELTLPPLEHLNLCLRLYFTKVHPIFPMIHVGTFRPCRANGPLVIMMCAMGSIFTGFDGAVKQGLHLYDHLQKSILLRWESAAAKNQESHVINIQLALIGQLFGILSGIPALLITVDCLHGMILSWARHFGSCRPLPLVSTDLNVSGAQLDSLWRRWARCEEWIRITHCLYILDSEIAHLVHRETLQSFAAYPHRLTSSDEAFAARNARDWRERYLKDLQLSPTASGLWNEWRTVSPQNADNFRRIPSTCGLTVYMILQSIGMAARSLHRRNSSDECNLEALLKSLVTFRRSVLKNEGSTVQSDLQMHVLWHATFVAALANLDLLERAVGRDGNALSPEDQSAVISWANSSDGARCILHALMIGKYTQSITISQAVAMHVPRAVFWASLTISTFVRFEARRTLAAIFTDHDFEEIEPGQLEETKLLSATCGAETALKMVMSTMRGLLQHHGQWGLSRRFASILSEISRSEGKT